MGLYAKNRKSSMQHATVNELTYMCYVCAVSMSDCSPNMLPVQRLNPVPQTLIMFIVSY